MKHATHVAVPQRQRRLAKSMRTKMTEPERKLWGALRQRLPIQGSRFRRQVPIGPFIADFCCQGAKLVIEVDGNQHGTDEAIAFDARRTGLIESQGYRVLRFSNFDVTCSMESVLDTIFAAAAAGTPTPSPSPQEPAPGRAQARAGWGGEEPRPHA